MMNKKPLLYKLGVMLLGDIFKFYYNPIIIGKENIPKDGSVIIASNHIHLFDQCHILISTKRYINYLAKKEYFDSIKTRWFFKGVGCIPVDRTKKDNNATSNALEVLHNKGAIGIFPEGTRNALKKQKINDLYDKYFKKYDKKEYKKMVKKANPKLSQVNLLEKLYNNKKISITEFYNSLKNIDEFLKTLVKKKVIKTEDYYESMLLSFKFGAVSLANKTNSKIVPVIITGDYKFRSNNLKILIGKEININNKNLEQANLMLRKQMINMLKENL